jgi:hypothetical protein
LFQIGPTGSYYGAEKIERRSPWREMDGETKMEVPAGVDAPWTEEDE